MPKVALHRRPLAVRQSPKGAPLSEVALFLGGLEAGKKRAGPLRRGWRGVSEPPHSLDGSQGPSPARSFIGGWWLLMTHQLSPVSVGHHLSFAGPPASAPDLAVGHRPGLRQACPIKKGPGGLQAGPSELAVPYKKTMQAFKESTKLSLEIARAHGRAQGLVYAAEMAQELYEAGHSPDVRALSVALLRMGKAETEQADRLVRLLDAPSPKRRRREEE